MKEMCLAKGNQCRGVVCDLSGTSCTMRTGLVLHSSGEKVFVKECPEATDSEISRDSDSHAEQDCAESGAASSATDTVDVATGDASASSTEHLQGTAIAVLAHNRAEDLRSCLNSLLGLREVSLFK